MSAWSFAFYLGASSSPMRWTHGIEIASIPCVFWLRKEVVLNALKFGIAFELVARAFGTFPGAEATAQSHLLLIVHPPW